MCPPVAGAPQSEEQRACVICLLSRPAVPKLSLCPHPGTGVWILVHTRVPRASSPGAGELLFTQNSGEDEGQGAG